MKIMVTGSSGHLGEALVRTLTERGFDVLGLDIKKSAFTSVVASVELCRARNDDIGVLF